MTHQARAVTNARLDTQSMDGQLVLVVVILLVAALAIR